MNDEQLCEFIEKYVISKYSSKDLDVRALLSDRDMFTTTDSLLKLKNYFSEKFDVEMFLTQNGIELDNLKNKLLTGFLLYKLGYFERQNRTFDYKDIFPAEFIPTSKNGVKNLYSQFKNYDDIEKYGLNIYACKYDAWFDGADLLERFTYGYWEEEYKLEELLNDDTIKADKDLFARLEVLKERLLQYIPEDRLDDVVIIQREMNKGNIICETIKCKIGAVNFSIFFDYGIIVCSRSDDEMDNEPYYIDEDIKNRFGVEKQNSKIREIFGNESSPSDIKAIFANDLSTNALNNGTITPEVALQSALYGLTSEDINNVGKEIPSKGELTKNE